MARLNVIANYDCDTKSFDKRNIFSIPGLWECAPIVSCFYGTLGLMSGFMNRNGAHPGIKAMCPLTLAVDGEPVHLTSLAQKIGAIDSDSVYTMFLDSTTFSYMLSMEEVFRVNIVVNRFGNDAEKELPDCRGWKVVEHHDTDGGYSVFVLERDTEAKLGDEVLDLDIDAIEQEMNKPGMGDLTPESMASIDNLLKVTEDTWTVFKKYNRDMMAFLQNTSGETAEGEFNSDGYDGCLEGGAGELDETGVSEDARNTPASLALVQMLSNTLRRQADMLVADRQKICKQQEDINALKNKFAEYDQVLSEAFRKNEEEQAMNIRLSEERLKGLTNQIDLLANEMRHRKSMTKLDAIFSILLLLGLIATVLLR